MMNLLSTIRLKFRKNKSKLLIITRKKNFRRRNKNFKGLLYINETNLKKKSERIWFTIEK